MGGTDEADPLDELSDRALQQEIELLGDLIEALAGADHPLCEAEIDRALHLTEAPGEPGAGHGAAAAG
jgi:hypothetical protein